MMIHGQQNIKFIRKGHPLACTDTRTFSIFLKSAQQLSLRDVADEIWVQNDFGHFYICYHTFSLHNKPAVYMPALKLLSLNGKPKAIEFLSAVYLQNGD
jgi:hypothetical protein